MTDRTTVTITSFENFEAAFGSVGVMPSSRHGPNKRTQDGKEWYVVRNFLKDTISGIFIAPISIRKACPPDPDFVVLGSTNEIIASIEITEATVESDQREMTKGELVKGPWRLGSFGGRFAEGTANPKWTWVEDIIAVAATVFCR